MKKILKILSVICVLVICITYLTSIIYKNILITQIDISKEFLNYTFQSKNWQIKKEKLTGFYLPSGPEYKFINYCITYKDSENKSRQISGETLSKYTIENALCNIINEQLEIYKNINNIIVDLPYNRISTSINFKENVDIMDTTNGVKLYNIYEFLIDQCIRKNEITISTEIFVNGTDKDKLLLEKENIIRKVKEKFYNKTGYNINYEIIFQEYIPVFI